MVGSRDAFTEKAQGIQGVIPRGWLGWQDSKQEFIRCHNVPEKGFCYGLREKSLFNGEP